MLHYASLVFSLCVKRPTLDAIEPINKAFFDGLREVVLRPRHRRLRLHPHLGRVPRRKTEGSSLFSPALFIRSRGIPPTTFDPAYVHISSARQFRESHLIDSNPGEALSDPVS